MHRPQDQGLQITDEAPEQAHPDDISCMTSGADLTKEMDVNGVPCSIFAESRPFQAQATRDWLLQGAMALDVAVVTTVAKEFDRFMLRGLKLGTKTWEAAEVARQIETGHRTYPLIATHLCTAEWSIVIRMGELIFDPTSVLCIVIQYVGGRPHCSLFALLMASLRGCDRRVFAC